MHLQVGTEKRLLSDVLDSPERSAHCVKALEFLLQAPSDPADAVPPPSLREAFWPGGDLTAAGTPHTRVRPWEERCRLTEKGARSIDLPDHPCDPTGARADRRTDAGSASYPREVLRGERPKRVLVSFARSKETPSGKRPYQAGKPEPESMKKVNLHTKLHGFSPRTGGVSGVKISNFPLTLQSVYSTIIKRLQRVHYAMMREIARENEVTSAEYVRESGG